MQRVWVTSPSYQTAISFLIEARKSAGLSQRDLAERLNKPRSFVSKLENRERRLDVVEFVAYANALNISAGDLMTGLASTLSDPIIF